MMLHTPIPTGFNPKFTTGRGNRHQRRRRARIRDGLRHAALRADTAACLVKGEGLSVGDAAMRCGSCPPYVAAMLIIRASGHSMLRERVLRGVVPVLKAAEAVENVAKAIPAYRKFSSLERELFRIATGATADLGEHLRNSTSEQLVTTTKDMTPEWIFDRMIAPTMAEPVHPNIG
jgi:hypothetical protein